MATNKFLKIIIGSEDQFSGTFGKFRLGMNKMVIASVAAAGTALAAYGVAMHKSIRATATAHDATAKFAARIGISTEQLSKYNHVAELSGISTQQLNMGFQRMTRRIAEASHGMGVAGDSLKQLGIDVKEIAALSPDKQFEMITKSMSGLENQSEKVRLAMSFFDSEGVALIQTMRGGAEGLEAMKLEAEKFGLVVSTQAAANAEEFNDSLTRVQGAFRGLRNTMAEDVMPTITAVQNRFANWIANNRPQIIAFAEKASLAMAMFAEKAAYAVGIAVDSFRGLQMTFNLVKAGLSEFVGLFVKYFDFLAEKAIQFMERFNIAGIYDEAIEKASGFKTATEDVIYALEATSTEAMNKVKEIAEKGLATEKVANYVEFIKEQFAVLRQEALTHQAEMTDIVTTSDEDAKMKTKAERDKEAADEKATHDKRVAAKQQFYQHSHALGLVAGKAGFKLSKGIAIAEAIDNTHAAAIKSYQALAGIPIIGPALGVAAAGMAIAYGMARVKQIKSQKFQPRARGGRAIAGQSYLVGEEEPEILTMGNTSGFVTPASAAGGGGASIGQVNVEVMPNATNAQALLNMDVSDWEEITRDKIIPALQTLENAGIMV